jgi:hypothetical protein
MKGTRTLDNFYGVSTLTTLGCHKVTFFINVMAIPTLETCQRSLKVKQYVVYQDYNQSGKWCVEHIRKENKPRLNTRRLLTF